MIWVVDHYDSFVVNLARYFRLLGEPVQIFDVANFVEQTRDLPNPDGVILSPGPDHPEDYPQMIRWVKKNIAVLPLFGVCLGHQLLAHALGGRVSMAKHPRHGVSTVMHHQGQGLFYGLPRSFRVAHYHSLIVSDPGPFAVDALSDEGEIMAMHHPQYPLYGLQFHPESILTEFGLEMCRSFLAEIKHESV